MCSCVYFVHSADATTVVAVMAAAAAQRNNGQILE